MYDYQFSFQTFDGERHFYMERYSKELSDAGVSKELDKIIRKFDNVKSASLDRVFEVK